MSESETKPHLREIVQEIEVDAPIERVWEAISSASEVSRWYPLEAKVEPGAGGVMTLSFGPGMEFSERIFVWRPGKHLRTASAAPGAPLPDSLPEFAEWMATSPTAMGPSILDLFLEDRGGKTLVRLVHSGFLSGAAWEDEYFNSVEKGWPFMLYGLRHYLQNHWGTPRIVAWPTRSVAVSLEEAWNRMMSPRGLLKAGSLAGLKPGDHYSIVTAAGDRFEGRVDGIGPGRFRATVENAPWNNAFFGLMVESCGGPTSAGLWLSTFGVPQAELDAFTARWRRLLDELFPEPLPAKADGPLAAPAQ